MATMKRSIVPATFLLILACTLGLYAAGELRVAAVEGSVKVQRSTSHSWEELRRGEKIHDNDIVETFFQTKLILEYGIENMVIVGSNSKALFNITTRDNNGGTDINTTLFGGGMFVKAVRNSHVGIYTAHGVAQLDSGAISSVVEAKSGNTGFQILGGQAEVRNIAQQDSRQFNVGQTTVIRPGKAPTAPLYITYRHVSVLKHFFGDDYIEQELARANIKPTEEKAGERASFSARLDQQRQQAADEGMYKTLFSLNRIYGSIMADQSRDSRAYLPISRPERLFSNKAELALGADLAFANGQVYPAFHLVPSFFFPRFTLGLRVPLARNAGGTFSLNAAGVGGILDKIHHLSLELPGGDSASAVSLREIRDLTVGTGLVVRNFSSRNIYSVLTPLGLTGQFHRENIHVEAFVADLAGPRTGGMHLAFTPGLTYLGAGFTYDADYHTSSFKAADSRFIAWPVPAATVVPDRGTEKANALIYDLNFGFDLVDNYELRTGLLFQFAQKFTDARSDGAAVSLPGFFFEWRWMKAGASFQVETQRMLIGQLHSFYESNRQRLVYYNIDTSYQLTQNNILSRKRAAQGFSLNYAAQLRRGATLEFNYKQDFSTRNPFTETESDSTFRKNDFSFDLAFTLDSTVLGPIAYSRLRLQQEHGGYYPTGGRPFASWGFSTSLEILSKPLFLNLAFETGVHFSYLDLDVNQPARRFNNNIDPGDVLFELFLGIRWGLL
jgi:hypothetical protein